MSNKTILLKLGTSQQEGCRKSRGGNPVITKKALLDCLWGNSVPIDVIYRWLKCKQPRHFLYVQGLLHKLVEKGVVTLTDGKYSYYEQNLSKEAVDEGQDCNRTEQGGNSGSSEGLHGEKDSSAGATS